MTDKTLSLWGATGVGKSTLLTAAFGTTPLLSELAPSEALTALTAQWAELCTGGVQPSTRDRIDYGLSLRGGGVLTIRDVKGGWAGSAADIEKQLVTADAVLIVLEALPDAAIQEQLKALRAAASVLVDRPSSIALTKADQMFPMADSAWLREGRWFQRTQYTSLVSTLPVPESNWWPVSALGFDPISGRPAVTVGEYDYVVPFNVHRPVNVREMFQDLLRRMGP